MIELLDLTKQFDDSFLAVDHLSLSVPPGEVYGLLGPNGAGKTTTLRMILGLLEPTSGDVAINGCRVSREPQRIKRYLGLVSSSAGLYQWLTPRESLAYFGVGHGLDQQRIIQRIEYLADMMKLASFMDRRCANLSTGQRQRVVLAQSLIHDPPVVLLDEPTRGLDVVGAQVVFDFVGRLREQGKAIIVCTHQLEEAERLCDRFGLLYHGKLRYQGTLEELKNQTQLPSLVEMFLMLLAGDEKARVPV